MPSIAVEGIRWVSDEPFPGWVEVGFTDASGTRHMLQGKWIEFADDWPSRSEIPAGLAARCEIVGGSDTSELVLIRFDQPSVAEGTTFRVRSASLD